MDFRPCGERSDRGDPAFRIVSPAVDLGLVRGWNLSCEGCPTFPTKLEPWWILKVTIRTTVLEVSPTFTAKLHPFGIVRPTAGASHVVYLEAIVCLNTRVRPTAACM